MAFSAYLTITGQKQGAIKGSVTIKGREGSIAVHSFSHSTELPFDTASGLPSGKRVHRPFTITKEIDQSSPLLWNALTNNESITGWQLKLWQATTGANPQEIQYYTITLTNALIVSITESADDQNPAAAPREEIAFVFQKIAWTWTAGAITGQDNWNTAV